jgi:hypothetical protein
MAHCEQVWGLFVYLQRTTQKQDKISITRAELETAVLLPDSLKNKNSFGKVNDHRTVVSL